MSDDAVHPLALLVATASVGWNLLHGGCGEAGRRACSAGGRTVAASVDVPAGVMTGVATMSGGGR